jgi:hypothetical protein
VCDLETSRMGAPYIYDISRLRVKLLSSDLLSGNARFKKFVMLLLQIHKKKLCFSTWRKNVELSLLRS